MGSGPQIGPLDLPMLGEIQDPVLDRDSCTMDHPVDFIIAIRSKSFSIHSRVGSGIYTSSK